MLLWPLWKWLVPGGMDGRVNVVVLTSATCAGRGAGALD